MGSIVISIILLIPVYYLVKIGVITYREHIDSRVQKLKIIQAIKGSKIFGLYEKLKVFGD